jgi:hypothetical protein
VTRASSARLVLAGIAQYAAIITATLLLADGVCILFNLFPPSYEYGDPELGWVMAPPTGAIHLEKCLEYSTGATHEFTRNEDGIRTSVGVPQILAFHDGVKIAVTGDSQTNLCAPNEATHPGVLERELNARGIPALVLPAAAARYSPLQDYLAFKRSLRRYDPRVLVLDFYTGNDFLDLLRPDDRPHFVKAGGGYGISGPDWYLYDDPEVKRRSRVLFALRSILKRTGLLGFGLRLQVLNRIASEQGEGLSTVFAYMNDLRKSSEPTLGYPEAYAAQMLNQQLFFHHFPKAREESLQQVHTLLKLARDENPGILLVLGALPSYQLVQEQPVDAKLLRVLGRIPVPYREGVRQEQELYDALRPLAEQNGWVFVDNLSALRKYRGPGRLYNDFDYHFRPAASEIIGRQEALAIEASIRSATAR